MCGLESTGPCEHDNELGICIKVGQFLEKVSNNKVTKKGPAVWNSFHVITQHEAHDLEETRHQYKYIKRKFVHKNCFPLCIILAFATRRTLIV